MGRRTPQSAAKRAREQGLREKRELKQAKKDARKRLAEDGPLLDEPGIDGESDETDELDPAADGSEVATDESEVPTAQPEVSTDTA